MTHGTGPGERAAYLAQVDEDLAQARYARTAVPLPTGDRLHDLAALDDAIEMIEPLWDQADLDVRAARAAAGPIPDLDAHREIMRLERRSNELWNLRQRAVARRDGMLRDMDVRPW